MAGEALRDLVLPWLLRQLSPGRVFALGVNGPQGAGKTTLTAGLCASLRAGGLRVESVSIDDFYLPRAGQVALAAAHPGNPLLQQRGYPGTHDLALGQRTLEALRSPMAATVPVPRYDKSAHGGQGDREPPARWATAATPLDCLLLEGWMLGFAPVPEASLPDASFRFVNEALTGYRAWLGCLDGFLFLDPESAGFVVDWRAEAEAKMRAAGQGGMSDVEIRAYARKFLPAYDTYLPGLRQRSPVPGPHATIRLGSERQVISSTFGS